MILAGDLNTSLHRIQHCVGLNDFQDAKGRRSGPRHPDSSLLGDLLVQHGLTAINTWDTTLGPTYTGGHSNKSRIDYVLVRHKSSDSITKKPLYLKELPRCLDTPKTTFPFSSRFPTRGGPGLDPRMASHEGNKIFFFSFGNFRVMIGVLSVPRWSTPLGRSGPNLWILRLSITFSSMAAKTLLHTPGANKTVLLPSGHGRRGILASPSRKLLPGRTTPADSNSSLGTGPRLPKFNGGKGQPIKSQGCQKSQAFKHH